MDESFYAKANANLSFAKLGIEYFKVHHDNQEIFGGMLTIPISGSLYVYGDYYENLNADKGTPKAWSAGLGFDNFNASRPGTFKLNVGHYDIEKESIAEAAHSRPMPFIMPLMRISPSGMHLVNSPSPRMYTSMQNMLLTLTAKTAMIMKTP